MQLTLEAVERADGRLALFVGDVVVHLTLEQSALLKPAAAPATKKEPPATPHPRHAAARAKAKQIWDQGERVFTTIGEAVGVSGTTVSNWKRLDGWKDAPATANGKRGVPLPGLAPSDTALDRETGVTRRCEQCNARTSRTVCPNGHAMALKTAGRQ